MIPYFASLGDDLERRWRRQSYDEEAFPGLALAAMERRPPHGEVAAADVVDWVFDPGQTFRQPSYRVLFGEPPVMLYQAPRFYIEALFWRSGTTDIHEHGFSGAFAVLAGSSVHSHWRFTPERAINSRMLSGRLERVSTEILRPGGIRPIRSGDRLIHQLFHLEVPSVTVVVRTYEDRDHLPQYKYLPPGLAIDPESGDGLRTRRLLFLEGMARGQIDGLRKHAGRLAEEADAETVFYMLSALTRLKVDRELLAELYGTARRRFGELADLFERACDTERRIRLVTALRGKVTDPTARFVLALLMLMPDRDSVLEAVRLEFPADEPLAVVEAGLAAMSGKESLGFELDDANRLIVRGLIEGLDEESLLARMIAEFRSDSVAEHRERLLQHARQLARSELLRPLVSASPLGAAAAP